MMRPSYGERERLADNQLTTRKSRLKGVRSNVSVLLTPSGGRRQILLKSLKAAVGSTSQFVTIWLRFCRFWPTAQLAKPQS
jgi:hypothetical protein